MESTLQDQDVVRIRNFEEARQVSFHRVQDIHSNLTAMAMLFHAPGEVSNCLRDRVEKSMVGCVYSQSSALVVLQGCCGSGQDICRQSGRASSKVNNVFSLHLCGL